jgi:hypothetical protein
MIIRKNDQAQTKASLYKRRAFTQGGFSGLFVIATCYGKNYHHSQHAVLQAPHDTDSP